MTEVNQISEIESWQKAEDERLEYEGYCNKIRKGLEDLDENSGERAIWELIQNARDMSHEASIRIELTNKDITFSHHGRPFDYTSFRALVKQDSSKDRTGAEQVGQYGTGFMTTHAFNRTVYISGPFEVKKGKDEIVGYVQIRDFELNRTLVDTKMGPEKMREQLEGVRELCHGCIASDMNDDTTSFRYELTFSQVNGISCQLSNALRLMPFVLVINDSIKAIEIINHQKGEHIRFTKDEPSSL